MDKKKALSTMGKAAVSAIPFVGGSIASLWSDLESSQIERKISRCQFITICREPGCCGGIGESNKILEYLDQYLFEGNLGTMSII